MYENEQIAEILKLQARGASRLPWIELARLAKAHLREEPSSSDETMERYLRRWFCLRFNLPLRSPILDRYTLAEMAYELLLNHYQNGGLEAEEKEEQAAKDLEWAKREALRMGQEAAKAKSPPAVPDLSTTFVKPPTGSEVP